MVKTVDIVKYTITDDSNDDPVLTKVFIYRYIKAEVHPASMGVVTKLKQLQSGDIKTSALFVFPQQRLTERIFNDPSKDGAEIKEGFEVVINGTDYRIIDMKDYGSSQEIVVMLHGRS